MVRTSSKKQKLRRLLGELRPFRFDLFKGSVFLFISSPGRLIHPLIWMFVIDRVVENKEVDLLVPALLAMVVIQGLSLLFGVGQDRSFEMAGQKFIRDLRNRLFTKLNRQSIGYFHSQRTGDLQSRVISDIQTIQSSLIAGLNTMLDELVTFVGVICIILNINWMIGLFVIIPLALTFIIVNHFNKRLKQLYQDASKILGEVGARLQDSLAGHTVVSAFGRGKEEEGAFRKATDKHFSKTMETVRMRTVLFPTAFFVGFMTNVIMLGLGVHFVLEGQLTLGGLVAIRIYWWQLNSPMRTLATVNDLIQRALASSERVYEVLDTPEELAEPAKPQTIEHSSLPIIFDSITFYYDKEKPVLDDLNFTIEPRTRVAIAGESGGGKTTILNLLMRFYDPIQGHILCGSTDLKDLTRAHWRSFVAPVFQETFLFHASIRDNLFYGKLNASHEELQEALSKANAWRFVEELPQGLDTVVGERGVKLSGGQRQRLGIARAFLSNPQILLLDEPTSSVEQESEQIIIQSIKELMKGRTVIMTSHRSSLLEQADQLLTLDRGRIYPEASTTILK
ncbi:MAG: ABC transporter ATP-binding protein [Verrucomicrobiota bacterium]